MTSSHRPALKAARRCIRPLTVVSLQNDPGALKRRLTTRRTEEPQIADHQRPDRLGIPNEDIIERQTQAIGLPVIVEDVDHQHAWLTPGCCKAVTALGRLAAAVRTPGAHTSAIKT